jgi:hypothetical protein
MEEQFMAQYTVTLGQLKNMHILLECIFPSTVMGNPTLRGKPLAHVLHYHILADLP